MKLFRRLSCALPALVLLSGGAALADETASDVAAKALASHWGYDFLADLTTDIGPRIAGSKAEQDAAAWAADRLKKAGFDEVHLEKFPVTYWARGAEEADIVQPRLQHLVVTALGHSVPTPSGGIEAPVVIFKSFQDLLAAPEGSLKGKIAVITERMVRAQDGEGYGIAVKSRVAGPSEAAKRGALALVIRSVGTDNHRIAHTGLTLYAKDAPKIPAAAISNPDADLLERMAAKGPVKLRLKLENKSTDSEAVTVVGELKGREHPEQVVLISGHLDSWEPGTGAIDDGAGVAIAAGAGKVIADLGQRPKRTIRVVMFGAEEIARASDAYEAAHAKEAANIVIAGESDFGAGKIYNARLPGGAVDTPFAKQLNAAILPLGVDLLSRPSSEGGADIEGIHEKDGVPFMDFGQDGTHYFDIHHTADDTLDKVDPAELAQNVAVWASFAWLAANSDVDFRAKSATAGSAK
jgi:Zn-dependent M28 family amino/carboxypeptidase